MSAFFEPFLKGDNVNGFGLCEHGEQGGVDFPVAHVVEEVGIGAETFGGFRHAGLGREHDAAQDTLFGNLRVRGQAFLPT